MSDRRVALAEEGLKYHETNVSKLQLATRVSRLDEACGIEMVARRYLEILFNENLTGFSTRLWGMINVGRQ
jgi:hypothetical protein